jgi:hypothetical protein
MLGLAIGAGTWSVLLAAPILALVLERRRRRSRVAPAGTS